MGEATEPNGHPVEVAKDHASRPAASEQPGSTEKSFEPSKKRPKKRGPNYAQIHSKPLPLDVHPLPAFHPSNPISLLRLAYVFIGHLIYPPTSHPAEKYIGYFSPETRSVHVTDPHHVRALWEMGFFGKGTLSRSEPSWMERERARLKAKQSGGGGTAEEATNARREDRRRKKMERARMEAEKIERQRLIEEGKLDPTLLEASDETNTIPEPVAQPETSSVKAEQPVIQPTLTTTRPPKEYNQPDDDIPTFANQEYLQLTLEEAFFLSYALGVFSIQHPTTTPSSTPLTPQALLPLFANHTFFPPRHSPLLQPLPNPDDPFLLSYATYHHFRSLGWVVRSGVKFSVDYLLYYRGPVFSHAEFAIMIVPAYTHAYWSTEEGNARRRVKDEAGKDWWWVHCVNRVQSQVLKNLVLVYVDVPPEVPMRGEGGGVDIGRLLKGYTIREFVVKRWVANRSRD